MPAANDALVEVLTRFASTLADRFDVTDVLYALTDQTVEVLDATAAGVSLADDKDRLEFVSANSDAAAQLERVQQDSKQGPCHQAYTTGTAVVVNDLSTTTHWPIYQRGASELGFHSVLGIPMQVRDRRLGALNVYHNKTREWTDDEVRAARVLADIATSYVLHASNLDQADRLNEQLQHALDSRIVIEQAKGLIAGESGITLDAAFETLRSHSRNGQATLRSVAEAVVNLGLRPPPPANKNSKKRGHEQQPS